MKRMFLMKYDDYTTKYEGGVFLTSIVMYGWLNNTISK